MIKVKSSRKCAIACIHRTAKELITGLCFILVAGTCANAGEPAPHSRRAFPPHVEMNKNLYPLKQDTAENPYLLSLLPIPQQVSLSKRTFPFENGWIIETPDTAAINPAISSLVKELGKQNIRITKAGDKTQGPKGRIRLVVTPGAVPIGTATDTNRAALEKQAYHMKLSHNEIAITANAPQGLYYGVQTLLQMVTSQKGKVLLPEGEIVDWPDLNIRMIYWDNAHHLEKMATMKRIIAQAAFYKINAFTIKLEGHFKFKSAPAIVEPYALSPGELQELTDYAASHYVELVPYLDAPAHVSFILKHPEYAHLRLFPENNYQFSVTNPGTYKLLNGMFSDLMSANKGGHYMLLSTDEAYYTGKGGDEVAAAKSVGGNGKLLAQFIKRMADTLHEQGRTVLFWGEYPLTVNDIPDLPSHLVNGVYNGEIAEHFKRRGIRQFIYTATQGEEPVFPTYYPIAITDSTKERANLSPGRVEGLLKDIVPAIDQKKSDFMGVVIAGWSDAGLHPETFWLGYATGTAMGWNHRGITPDGLSERFFRSFYGAPALKMDSVYRLLSRQAQFYDQSWDWTPSRWRKPILGNSEGIFEKPQPERDQVLPMLPVPSSAALVVTHDWDSANRQRIVLAKKFLQENDRLAELLKSSQRIGVQKQYNLEVLTSVSALCRQNLEMLLSLQKMSNLLKEASAMGAADPRKGVENLDAALDLAATIKRRRNAMLAALRQVWYKDWQPLVLEANGRRFLHELDDIKDHRPGRTIDLSYLIFRDVHYPLGKWAEAVQHSRNEYARKKGLSLRKGILDWEVID